MKAWSGPLSGGSSVQGLSHHVSIEPDDSWEMPGGYRRHLDALPRSYHRHRRAAEEHELATIRSPHRRAAGLFARMFVRFSLF